MHIFLDVSRLLFTIARTTPSGIDRVELAYARRWLGRPATDATFVAQSPLGWFAAVPRADVAGLVEALDTLWHVPAGTPAAKAALRRRGRIVAGLSARMAIGAGIRNLRGALARHQRSVFLLVSHRALDRPRPIAALRAAGAAFVPLIHDLIPLTHPEYARPAQVERHGRRVATVAAEADGILANSAATAACLAARLAAEGARPAVPMAVAPLGLDDHAAPPGPPAAEAGGRPTFVCLGTIEPRKNHLLLLHLWREFAARRMPDTPRLVIVGRRGWENENILDLLDRCPALTGLVEERRAASDQEVTALLQGSRALLFPSFAEGYGLPLAEALALGVPALCSDIPALREVGGEVPEFLDPLDGAAWRQGILDYAAPAAPRRAAQLGRLAAWQAPRWAQHFDILDNLLETVLRAAPQPTARRRPATAGAPLADRPALPAGATTA